MITAKILALFGLYAPSSVDDSEMRRAMHHVNTVLFQNQHINRQAQTVALDTIDQHQSDERLTQMSQDAESLRATTEAVLGRRHQL